MILKLLNLIIDEIKDKMLYSNLEIKDRKEFAKALEYIDKAYAIIFKKGGM